MRKPDFYLCENKGVDQLQCFSAPLYKFATRLVQFLLYLYPKFQDSNFLLRLYKPLCQTWSEIWKTGFLAPWLIWSHCVSMIFSCCIIQSKTNEPQRPDQLCSNLEADQHLCFHYTNSIISIHSKFIDFQPCLLWLYMLVCVGPGRKPLWWFSRITSQMLFPYCFSRDSICINHACFRKFINGPMYN